MLPSHLSLQDNIQGQIFISDLLRLPSAGKLLPEAAPLETDIDGNHRQVRGGILTFGRNDLRGGDGTSGGNFSVYTCGIFGGLLSAPGGGIHAGWGDHMQREEAEADTGGSESLGRCHSVQCRHHSNLHSPLLLLRHCAFCQPTPRCRAEGRPGRDDGCSFRAPGWRLPWGPLRLPLCPARPLPAPTGHLRECSVSWNLVLV
uniref:Uncharacterized protein n=1 Tax=Mola mola TaxID=94237 RepID=A0A3Q4AG92_MOLML